jgi:Domain of unknown function (DUF5916)/AMIN domain
MTRVTGLIAGVIIGAAAHAAAEQTHRAAGATARRAQLKAVRVRAARDSVQVTLVFDGPARYKASRTAQPPRITIDIPDTTVSPLLTRREFLSEHAALIRVLVVRSGGLTRAILDLAQAGPHAVYSASGANQIVVDIKSVVRDAAAPVKYAPQPAATRPSVPLAAAAAPPGLPRPAGADAGAAATTALPRIAERDTTPAPAVVRIPWVPRRPQMSDFTADWSLPDGVRVSEFRQREPAEGNLATERTLVYLSYDTEYLYAAFVCHDASGNVRTHLTPREDIGGDDQVAVYLDTFRDGRHAYVFASNPSGVQQDGVIDEGDDASYEADTLWYSQGRLTRDGFVVLMAIPFKSVRFSSAPVQEWRIALGRTIARRGESAFWPQIGTRGRGFVRQMGALEGLELISPGHNLQFIPFGTFTRADSRGGADGAAVTSESRRVGLDAKIVLKNAVTIDAAANPDFSEVESNEPQVAVNQRFELFLPEKRPFFTENAALFATPVNIFFSRRVADPEFGVKMTARSTHWVFGALAADDRAVDPAEAGGWFGRKAAVGVVRAEGQFADRARLGVLATERQTGTSSSRVVSLDGRLTVAPSWSVSVQAAGSDDVDSQGTRTDGAAYFAGLSRTGAHFNYIGSYRDLGASFRAPLGYVPRVDIRAMEHYASYVWRPDDGGTWAFGPSVSAAADWDHAGRLQDRWASADMALFLAGQLEAHAARSESYELFADIPFRKNATSVSISTATPSWVFLWASYSWGTGINYSPPAGMAPFLGASQGAYGSLTLRPTARLRFDEMYLHERLQTLPDASTATQPIFSTHIVRSKVNLQITRALALRAIVDYNALAAGRSLFLDTNATRLTGDALVTYLLHPGTALYIGFNDSYEDIDPDPRRPLRLPGSPVGRQIFVKLSYLLRF